MFTRGHALEACCFCGHLDVMLARDLNLEPRFSSHSPKPSTYPTARVAKTPTSSLGGQQRQCKEQEGRQRHWQDW